MSSIFDGIGDDGVEQLDENLRKWFKEKWVRFGPDGKIRGACARGDDSEGKPKCLPQKKAQNLGKKGRKYAASKKRREDPNPERRGKAKNVATKKKTNEDITEGFFDLFKKKAAPMKPAVSKEEFEKKSKTWKNSMVNAYRRIPELIRLNQWAQIKSTATRIKNGIKTGIDEGYITFETPEKADSAIKRISSALNLKIFDEVKVNPENFAGGGTGALIGLALAGPVGGALGGALGGMRKAGKLSKQELAIANAQQQTNTRRQDNKEAVIQRIEKFEPTFIKIVALPAKTINEGVPFDECPSCRGPIVHESMMNEKQDACYHKVKSRYKVWPSAYASGALVQCRKKGASNWGTGGKKKNESNIMKGIVDEAGSAAQQAAIAINMKKRGEKPKNEASGTPGGLERYRTPAMVNATMQQNLYKRELAPIKAAEKKRKEAEYRKNNPSVSVPNIQIGASNYPIPVIQSWIDNKDFNAALEFAVNKFAHKQSKDFKTELAGDPNFQKAIENFFNVAEKTLNYRNSTRTKSPWDGKIRAAHKETDISSDGFDAINNINDALLPYYKKYGVDKTGRRVPPGFNYNLEEARAKQYVKPYNSPQTGEQIGWVSSDGYHKKYWQVFAKDSAIKHAKINPDEVQEDYTGEFAAEKTPAINPYGGLKDKKFRGAISEEPTTSGPIGTQPGGWRKYKPKPAGEIEEDTSYAGGMGQGGNAGESYRKFKPKSAGTFKEEQLDEKCWDTHKQVGMKNKGGRQVPNCVPKESAILKGLRK